MLGQIDIYRGQRRFQGNRPRRAPLLECRTGPRGPFTMPGSGLGNAGEVVGEPMKLIGYGVVAWFVWNWLKGKAKSAGEARRKRKSAKKRRKAEQYAAKMRELGFDVRYSEEQTPGLWGR